MTSRFENRTVMITGGGGGIGSELTLRFAAEGARVLCLDVDRERAERACEQAGGQALAVVCDVTDGAQLDRVLAEHGAVDVLVNNSLCVTGDNLVETSDESLRADIEGTLTTAFLCTKRVLPGMIERRRGSIVNLASVNALGYFGNEAYSASKAGLINLTRSVAVRYGRYGVRANAVAPGTIATPVWNARLAIEPDLLDRLARWYPLRRVGTPQDVANAVLFLASDEAAFTSGACLTVDGGLTAGQGLFAEELLVESRTAEL